MQASSSPQVHRQALLGLLLANLFWGLSFPLVKAVVYLHQQLLPGSGNWFITAMTLAPRFLLAALVLGLVAGRQIAGATRAEIRQGLLIGFANALGMMFQVDGLQYTSASVSSFLTQFSAILIPMVVAVRSRAVPAARVCVCAALVLAGVAILGRFDFRAMKLGRGEWETLLCSLFFTWQILLIESPRNHGNRLLPVSAVMFASEGLLFAGLALGTARSPADCLVPWTSPSWVVFTLLLTGLCTLAAFLLMNRWQPKITATEAGLIYCFEPVFASVMALFLPALLSGWAGLAYANELVTWPLLVGGGFITLANGLLQLKPPARVRS